MLNLEENLIYALLMILFNQLFLLKTKGEKHIHN